MVAPFLTAQGIGATTSAAGGYLSGRSKKKAAEKMLKNMQKALQMYQTGSKDAYGNRLSSDKNGLWSYNLNRPTQKAVSGANNAMSMLGNYQPKSRSQYLAEGLAGLNYANKQVADANQAAAMKNGLRQGSNLNYVANSFNKQNAQNLRNAYINAQQNAANWQSNNANIMNNLATAANNAQAPIQNIQSNLQNMVNSLNKTAMEQQNQIAGAASNPYLHGQATADLVKGIGSGISGMGQNMQQQSNHNNLLELIQQNPQLTKYLFSYGG